MKKKIVCLLAIIILIFPNMVFADIKSDINKLDIISNSLDSLFISTIKETEDSNIAKRISFIEGEISNEKNQILDKLNKLSKADEDNRVQYLAILSILNYYEISIIQFRKYYTGNQSKAFVDAIASFAEANTVLANVKSRLQ